MYQEDEHKYSSSSYAPHSHENNRNYGHNHRAVSPGEEKTHDFQHDRINIQIRRKSHAPTLSPTSFSSSSGEGTAPFASSLPQELGLISSTGSSGILPFQGDVNTSQLLFASGTLYLPGQHPQTFTASPQMSDSLSSRTSSASSSNPSSVSISPTIPLGLGSIWDTQILAPTSNHHPLSLHNANPKLLLNDSLGFSTVNTPPPPPPPSLISGLSQTHDPHALVLPFNFKVSYYLQGTIITLENWAAVQQLQSDDTICINKGELLDLLRNVHNSNNQLISAMMTLQSSSSSGLSDPGAYIPSAFLNNSTPGFDQVNLSPPFHPLPLPHSHSSNPISLHEQSASDSHSIPPTADMHSSDLSIPSYSSSASSSDSAEIARQFGMFRLPPRPPSSSSSSSSIHDSTSHLHIPPPPPPVQLQQQQLPQPPPPPPPLESPRQAIHYPGHTVASGNKTSHNDYYTSSHNRRNSMPNMSHNPQTSQFHMVPPPPPPPDDILYGDASSQYNHSNQQNAPQSGEKLTRSERRRRWYTDYLTRNNENKKTQPY